MIVERILCNGNAYLDAKWDAQRGLGYRNQYNVGSMSWLVYERAYTFWS